MVITELPQSIGKCKLCECLTPSHRIPDGLVIKFGYNQSRLIGWANWSESLLEDLVKQRHGE